jgi:hypothetical protein
MLSLLWISRNYAANRDFYRVKRNPMLFDSG